MSLSYSYAYRVLSAVDHARRRVPGHHTEADAALSRVYTTLSSIETNLNAYGAWSLVASKAPGLASHIEAIYDAVRDVSSRTSAAGNEDAAKGTEDEVRWVGLALGWASKSHQAPKCQLISSLGLVAGGRGVQDLLSCRLERARDWPLGREALRLQPGPTHSRARLGRLQLLSRL